MRIVKSRALSLARSFDVWKRQFIWRLDVRQTYGKWISTQMSMIIEASIFRLIAECLYIDIFFLDLIQDVLSKHKSLQAIQSTRW